MKAETRTQRYEWTEYQCPVCGLWEPASRVEMPFDDVMKIFAFCERGHEFEIRDGEVTMIDAHPAVYIPRILERWDDRA